MDCVDGGESAHAIDAAGVGPQDGRHGLLGGQCGVAAV